MGLLASILAYLLKWILELGGRWLYEQTTLLVEKKKKEAREKENLKRYQDAKKKKASDDEMLDRETDIING
jgi:hypothetical protein